MQPFALALLALAAAPALVDAACKRTEANTNGKFETYVGTFDGVNVSTDCAARCDQQKDCTAWKVRPVDRRRS